MIPSTVKNCVLDSECVAWDRKEEKMLSFQILSTRGKKVFDSEKKE